MLALLVSSVAACNAGDDDVGVMPVPSTGPDVGGYPQVGGHRRRDLCQPSAPPSLSWYLAEGAALLQRVGAERVDLVRRRRSSARAALSTPPRTPATAVTSPTLPKSMSAITIRRRTGWLTAASDSLVVNPATGQRRTCLEPGRSLLATSRGEDSQGRSATAGPPAIRITPIVRGPGGLCRHRSRDLPAVPGLVFDEGIGGTGVPPDVIGDVAPNGAQGDGQLVGQLAEEFGIEVGVGPPVDDREGRPA